MERSKFSFTVEIDTAWQIDYDAAAIYLQQAIEDSVLGIASEIQVEVTQYRPSGRTMVRSTTVVR